MMIELIFFEILFWAGALYLSVFEWIKVRDIKSNEKNDFFIPAGFLALVFTGSLLLQIPIFSAICAIAFLPLIISLVMTGLAQDKQKFDGDLTYNAGDRFWVTLNEDVSLTKDQEAFIGKEGEIIEVKHDRTVSMTFADGSEAEFPIKCLSNTPPNPEKPEINGWWTK
tara:strand:- start:196 stop:699 length:504 start_codon:yes stop_codon:yes gene_type:complete